MAKEGNTEVHEAAERGDLGKIQQLKEAGADTSGKNGEGKRPAEVATDPVVAGACDYGVERTNIEPGLFAAMAKNTIGNNSQSIPLNYYGKRPLK